MTGRKAPTHVNKIVIGAPKFHLETENCPARVASRKKIHKKRRELERLASEMQQIDSEIQNKKAGMGPSKVGARKHSVAGKKKNLRGKRKAQKKKVKAAPLGFDYNGMPIYYEDNPGEHGVSTGFDNYMRKAAETEQTLESWEAFATERNENSEKRRREEEERDFVKQMQNANLKDIFDTYETAHAANWGNVPVADKETRESAKEFVVQYSKSQPALPTAAYASQEFLTQADSSFLSDMQGMETRHQQMHMTMQTKRSLPHKQSYTNSSTSTKSKSKSNSNSKLVKIGGTPTKLKFKTGVSDASKMHACYRVGSWNGLNKNTYSLNSCSSKHAAAMVSLRQAEKRMAEMRRQKMAADKAADEHATLASAMGNSRRWKHSKQAHTESKTAHFHDS